jgi:hypothetical protein
MEHLPVWFIALTWLISLVLSLVVGSFLPAYFKKKGENLATHEDLDKLVKQMEATTEATKAIEARISDEVWNKQRQWELKRENIIQLIRGLSTSENALMELHSMYAAPVPTVQELLVIRLQERKTKTDQWNAANLALDEARVIVSLVAGKELAKAAWGNTDAIRLAGKTILDGDTSGRMPHLRIDGMIRFDPSPTAAWLGERFIAA